VLRESFLAMGTQCVLSLALAPQADEVQARLALARARQRIEDFGRAWWPWGEGGLAAINRALAEGRAAHIPAAMQPLFARAWALREKSAGLFEPRLAALVRLWGFDDIARLRSAPPDAAAIASLLAAVRTAPAYEGGATCGPAPTVGWDFGAIAKGWIVDETLNALAGEGYGDALVDAGGNLAARGRRGSRAWRVGIRTPRAPDPADLLATLEIGDEAVITHGDDQRWFEHAGRRYAHLLDPRSGWPACGLRAVTVVHADAALADAGGAALFVAGARQWRAAAQRLGLTQVLIVDETGAVSGTAPLAGRLRAADGVKLRIL
jgi:thiamine biosynthesis lipoprotein